jgi:hypothetical protein
MSSGRSRGTQLFTLTAGDWWADQSRQNMSGVKRAKLEAWF